MEADLWLHVVDASDPSFRNQMHNVEQVLEELGGGPRLTQVVFNKMDTVADEAVSLALPIEFPGSLSVAARTRDGLDALVARLWELRRDARDTRATARRAESAST